MKRNFALIIASGLTTIVAVIILAVLAFNLVPVTEAGPAPLPAEVTTAASNPVEAWQAEVESTNQQLETVFLEREQAWQTRIAQQQEALTLLDNSSRDQIAQLGAQLNELQAQIEGTNANLGALQSHAASLQQAIQADNTTYQNELTAITNAQEQLRQQVDGATAQLEATYQALAQRQAAVAAASQGSSGGGGHDDDDGDDDHEDHEDDDDDHEEHEDHEDDD